MFRVQHLQFAHPDISRVAIAWIADRQAIVPPRWQLELHSRNEIAELFLGINRAALLGLANNRAVLHVIIADRPLPTREIFAIEHGLESFFSMRCQNLICFVRSDLAQKNIPPTNLTAMGLQFNGAFGGNGLLAI